MLNTLNYSIHANPLKDDEGRTTFQVRHDILGTLNTQGLVDHLKRHHLLANIPVEAVLEVLREEIVEHLLSNVNLHFDGIGTFYLNIGFKPVDDGEGGTCKRVVTNPEDIDGNDLVVTGLGFTPDKEFTQMVTWAPVHFEHSMQFADAGHSVVYTREEITNLVLSFIDEYGFISRRSFQQFFHLTYYSTRRWLEALTSGDNPPLLKSMEVTAYVYRRNPAYVSP